MPPATIRITIPVPQTIVDQNVEQVADPINGAWPTALPELIGGPGVSAWTRIDVIPFDEPPVSTVYRPGDASLAGTVADKVSSMQPCTTKAAKITKVRGRMLLAVTYVGRCLLPTVGGGVAVETRATPADRFGRVYALELVGKQTATTITMLVPDWWRGKVMKFPSGVTVRLP